MKAAIVFALLPALLLAVLAAEENPKLGAMRDFFDALGVPRMEAMDVQEEADKPDPHRTTATFGNGDDQYDTSTLRLLHVVSTGPSLGGGLGGRHGRLCQVVRDVTWANVGLGASALTGLACRGCTNHALAALSHQLSARRFSVPGANNLVQPSAGLRLPAADAVSGRLDTDPKRHLMKLHARPAP